MRDEDDGVASLAGTPDLGNPLGHPAAELECRLTGDVCGLANLERAQPGRARKPALRLVPLDHQLRWLRDPSTLLQRFFVTGANLAGQLDPLRANLVRLRNQHRRPPGNRQVVEYRGASVVVSRSGNELLQRNHGCLTEAPDGSLRRWIVGTNRLDRVADEFQTDGLLRTGRKEVDHTTAHAELARFVDRILTGVAGRGEQIGKVCGRDVLTRNEVRSGRRDSTGCADFRQQGGTRRDHQTRSSRGQRMQSARAGGSDLEMRGESPVRIDFVRREGQHDPLDVSVGEPLERGEEESGVARRALDVRVRRNDQDRDVPRSCGGREHRRCRRVEAGDGRLRHTHSQLARGRFQDRSKRQGTGGVGRHDGGPA